MMDRQEWLKERQSGIGGSDVAAIMGVDPFGKTAADVWDSKLLPIEDKSASPVQRRGVVLEPIAADEYVTLTGRQVRRQPMRRHKLYPFMIGNVDRQQIGGEFGPGILEIKCPGLRQFSKFMYHGLDAGKILQMMHYLEVFDYEWGTFAIFHSEYMKTVWFDVCRTEEHAAKLGGDRPAYVIDRELREQMIEAEIEFWEMVERKERPSKAIVEVVVPEAEGNIVVRDDPEWEEAARQIVEAKDLVKTAEAVNNDVVEHIKELCGGHGSYEGGGVRVHWKPTVGRRTFDKGALAAAAPLDRKHIEAMAGLCGRDPQSVDWDSYALDIESFYRVGDPGEKFVAYQLRQEIEEE